jgi:lysophospholipase L1-like esterase
MENFTFEFKDRKENLETWEWDRWMINHTEDKQGKRLLYIGDSISCGIRGVAKEEYGIYFDGYGTSKALDNPYFRPSLSLFAQQQGRRDVVLFNNGLHGWHLEDKTEYKEYLEDFVKYLMEEFKGTPIYIVLTTYYSNEKRVNRVVARNEVALVVAKKYNLPVIDLYTVSVNNKDLLSEDGVHFVDAGYEKLAQEILDKISEVFK